MSFCTGGDSDGDELPPIRRLIQAEENSGCVPGDRHSHELANDHFLAVSDLPSPSQRTSTYLSPVSDPGTPAYRYPMHSSHFFRIKGADDFRSVLTTKSVELRRKKLKRVSKVNAIVVVTCLSVQFTCWCRTCSGCEQLMEVNPPLLIACLT